MQKQSVSLTSWTFPTDRASSQAHVKEGQAQVGTGYPNARQNRVRTQLSLLVSFHNSGHMVSKSFLEP